MYIKPQLYMGEIGYATHYFNIATEFGDFQPIGKMAELV